MSETQPTVKFVPIEMPSRQQWYVLVMIPNAVHPEIHAFRTASDAHEWIREHSLEWLQEYTGRRASTRVETRALQMLSGDA
jgi:hypothetical protein